MSRTFFYIITIVSFSRNSSQMIDYTECLNVVHIQISLSSRKISSCFHVFFFFGSIICLRITFYILVFILSITIHPEQFLSLFLFLFHDIDIVFRVQANFFVEGYNLDLSDCFLISRFRLDPFVKKATQMYPFLCIASGGMKSSLSHY